MRAKKKISGQIAVSDRAEPSGHGSGITRRIEAPREAEYREVSRYDGLMMQLTQNGRVMMNDKTDATYRAIVWHHLGLKGRVKSWPIIYTLIRFLPRNLVSSVLYRSAADWTKLRNESLKMSLESLSSNHFTVAEAQAVFQQLDAKLMLGQMEINASRVREWDHFLSETELDVTTELERVRERAQAAEQAES